MGSGGREGNVGGRGKTGGRKLIGVWLRKGSSGKHGVGLFAEKWGEHGKKPLADRCVGNQLCSKVCRSILGFFSLLRISDGLSIVSCIFDLVSLVN